MPGRLGNLWQFIARRIQLTILQRLVRAHSTLLVILRHWTVPKALLFPPKVPLAQQISIQSAKTSKVVYYPQTRLLRVTKGLRRRRRNRCSRKIAARRSKHNYRLARRCGAGCAGWLYWMNGSVSWSSERSNYSCNTNWCNLKFISSLKYISTMRERFWDAVNVSLVRTVDVEWELLTAINITPSP